MLTSECTYKNVYAILMNKSQDYIIRGDVRGRSNTSVLFSCSIRKLIDLFLKVHKDYAWHFHYKVEQRCFVQSVNYCNPMWTKSFEFKKSALSLKSETYLPKSYRLFSAQFSWRSEITPSLFKIMHLKEPESLNYFKMYFTVLVLFVLFCFIF